MRSTGGNGQGEATHIWVSVNPSKFLQGHNIFGSDDLVSLVYDMFLMLCRSLEIEPRLDEVRLVKQGDYSFSS